MDAPPRFVRTEGEVEDVLHEVWRAYRHVELLRHVLDLLYHAELGPLQGSDCKLQRFSIRIYGLW